MWIERLEIAGFKRLADEFAFSERLTLVISDNEAGKSTLHEALVRALYGFPRRERDRRGRRTGPTALERCSPWQDQRPFRLVAHVHQPPGRRWRIEWDFTHYAARLIDAATGVDHTAEVVQAGGDFAVGEHLIGVGLDDFREVCCLSQIGQQPVRGTGSLTAALREAVASGAGNVRVDQAEQRLKDLLAQLGLRTDSYQPTPTGRAHRLVDRLAELEQHLTGCEQERYRITQLAEERTTVVSELGRLAGQEAKLQQSLLLVDANELQRRVAEADELEQRATPTADNAPLLDPTAVSAIRTAIAGLEQLRQPVAELEAEMAQNQDRIAEFERTRRELTQRLAELDAYANTDDSAEASIRTLSAQLQTMTESDDSSPAPIPARDPLLARYRAERDQLVGLQLQEQQPRMPPRLRRVLWIAVVVLTLGLAALARRLIRRLRKQPETSQGLAARLADFDATNLGQLDQRVAAEERTIAAAEALTAEVARQREQRESARARLEQQIAEVLDSVAAPEMPQLGKRISDYLTACEQHSARASVTHQSTQLDLELERLRAPANELRRRHTERDELQRQLRAAYLEARIEADDLDAAAAKLEQLEAREATAARQRNDAAAAGEALRTLLAGETRDALERHAEKAVTTLQTHVARQGQLVSEVPEPSRLRAEIEDVQARLRIAREHEVELRTQIDTAEQGLPAPGQLKEEIETVTRQLDRIELAKAAVHLARETLADAAEEAHREFAPHLTDALRRNLPRITNGRYQDAVVDDELAIQVVAPETGSLITTDLLSRATQDQIYLVERLEIARLLDRTMGAAPLLLDDPFAHFDASRLQAGIELLNEVAEQRQVIVFTEDPQLADLAETVATDSTRIVLAAPTERAHTIPSAA